jgi:PAS domain S-box-containing protein
MATGSISPARFLLALLVLLVFATSVNAAEPPEIRAGSELDFRPYCFTDKNGQPTGFGVELLQAAAEKATLPLRISPGEWDKVWNELVNGRIDVLPVVARTSSREGLVEFTLPHTETFDAFFVRTGRPPIKDLAAAAGKEIVVLRSDAAHHQLIERKFPGQIVPVDSIAEGLRLIASGKHDALLCSRLIGVLERDQAGIKSVTDGPVIPDYKRAFSFAVRKGNTELVERLNQGLRLVQADGTYDRLYRKWLGVQIRPLPTWQTYFWQALGILGVLVLIAITWLVARKALEWERRQSRVLTPKPPGVRSAFWPYALAVVAVATGYAVRVGLEEWVGRGLPAFSMFYPPVIVAALLGGLGPGLLATAAGAAIAVVLIMPSIGDLRVALPVERLSLVLYLITGLFMTAVAELHRRNRAKAAAFDREEALRETRREKEFLANLLEAAEQPFAIGYPDGRIGLVNRAYEQLTGYTAAELRALDWSVLAPPEWRDHERQKLAELHRTGQPVRYEKEHLHKDGTRVPVELFVNLGRDAAGQPEFYYAFITDITVRKRPKRRYSS